MGVRRRAYWIAWWIVVAASLWLRTGFPIRAKGFAGFDDALFVREARLLGAGMWLGPYDNRTLAKGMFYPLFIVTSFIAGIPLYIAEQLAYLGASAFASWLVLKFSGRRWLALVLFILLAFNPVVWHWEMIRVIREGLYISLTLTVVALTVAVAFPSMPTRGAWRRWALGCILGLVLSAFWLTREEGPWIIPALAVVLVLSVVNACWLAPVPGGSNFRGWLHAVALPMAAAGALCVAGIVAVSAMNYAYYGVFITNEFKSTPFLRAYGALSRIKHDEWRRYVVFPKDARQRAYSVSPAARELAPFLDGPLGDAWRKTGCQQIQATDCPEILSGWFMWALRDAVAAAGHYKSAPDAMAYYNRLADEINRACDEKKIECGPPRATLMPVFRREYIGDTLRDLPVLAHTIFTMADRQVGPTQSDGAEPELAIFRDTVGEIYPAHDPNQEVIQGWAASPSGRPNVAIQTSETDEIDTTLTYTPGDDVTAAYPGWIATRFYLRTSCLPDKCALVVHAPNGSSVTLPLAKAAQGQEIKDPQLRVFLDYAEMHDVGAASALRRAFILKIAKPIAWAYSVAFPPLAVVACLGLVLAIIKIRSQIVPPPLIAMTVASLVAIFSRALLLAYLDVTSIPSNSILYASPVSPLVVIFTVLGCWSLWKCLVPSRPR